MLQGLPPTGISPASVASTRQTSLMANSYIIAIDFGTAYSGYAFNITPSAEDTDPHIQMWGKEVGFNTPKTPTCILFDDSEEFMNFGYEAVERYKKMGGKEAKKYHFFENFKMALYGKVSKIVHPQMTRCISLLTVSYFIYCFQQVYYCHFM